MLKLNVGDFTKICLLAGALRLRILDIIVIGMMFSSVTCFSSYLQALCEEEREFEVVIH